MISGEFNRKGELFFEIGLIAAEGDVIPVKALLDTGFTGWLAINSQDAESLGWYQDSEQRDMQTALGEARFNLYEGTVLLDGKELSIEVLGGDELQEAIIGAPWLLTRRLVAEKAGGSADAGVRGRARVFQDSRWVGWRSATSLPTFNTSAVSLAK
jgi:predicted aspartyl protease